MIEMKLALRNENDQIFYKAGNALINLMQEKYAHFQLSNIKDILKSTVKINNKEYVLIRYSTHDVFG